MTGDVEVVLPTRDLDAELRFFTEQVGFGVDAVYPADDPNTAIVSTGGVRLRLTRSPSDRPLALHATGVGERRTLRSPGGTTIDIGPADDAVVVPDAAPSFVLRRANADDAWVTGRAGMRYRDMLPGRWGGRFIASHIHIPDGGPVPDYVHYHRIRFQMIVVKAGWVEVVYEDQGPPFVMHAGDAVLQPPEIRHRVLHSSADLEVIEIGCPAEHMTLADRELELPTAVVRADRDFGGQRFARSVLADRHDVRWAIGGYRAHDTGFGAATGGLVGARIVEPVGEPGSGGQVRGRIVEPVERSGSGEATGSRVGARTVERSGSERWPDHDTELAMLVVLDGTVGIERDGAELPPLGAGDAVAVPAGQHLRLAAPSPDLRLLDVTAPA